MPLPTNIEKLKKIHYMVATFFGAGFFPKIPGTFASITAFIPLIFLNSKGRTIFLAIGIIAILAVSLPMIRKVERESGADASIIVIDEILGVWLIFLSPMIPATLLGFLLGVGLFRLFDILKPGIIGKLNRQKGAKYVLLDDIVAACITSAILHLIFYLYKIAFSIYYLNKLLT